MPVSNRWPQWNPPGHCGYCGIPKITPHAKTANPRFLLLRNAAGNYDPRTTRQQGTSLQNTSVDDCCLKRKQPGQAGRLFRLIARVLHRYFRVEAT
jgi:hypothetical protein